MSKYKPQIFFIVGIIFVLIFIILTCFFPKPPNPIQTPTWTNKPTETATKIPTKTPTKIPPTFTLTPINTVFPTFTPTLKPTNTSVPTLTPTPDFRWWNCYVEAWMDYPRYKWFPCVKGK